MIGLRLRPGIGGIALGLPASEVRDTHEPADAIWGPAGSELADRLSEAASPRDRRALIEAEIIRRLAEAERPDPLVLAASRRLGFPGSRIGELSDSLGISDRQFRRRFHKAVGYGPKTLDRVLRFQRFVSRAPEVASGAGDLARIAADLGYADQAHLNRDCMQLSGLTPGRLADDRRRPMRAWSRANRTSAAAAAPGAMSQRVAFVCIADRT